MDLRSDRIDRGGGGRVSKAGRHFDRFRATAKLLKSMSEVEVKVAWLCESKADGDGTFVASASGIAGELALTVRAVEKAFAGLTRKGFMRSTTRAVGGRGRAAERQMQVPGNPEPLFGESTQNPESANTESANGECRNPEPGEHETPNHGARNPEPRSAHIEACFIHLLNTLQLGEDPSRFVPEALRTQAFIKALIEFHQHRREIKAKLTPMVVVKLFPKLLAWGPEKATAALEASIENGWRGVFEPNGGSNGSAKRTKGHPVHRGRTNDIPVQRSEVPIFGAVA